MNQAWLTPQEVADELRVNYITVLRWLNAGELRGYRLGTQWRIKREDLEAWLENRAGGVNPHTLAPAFASV